MVAWARYLSVAFRHNVYGLRRAGLLLGACLCVSFAAHAASSTPDGWVGDAIPEYITRAPRLPLEAEQQEPLDTATDLDLGLDFEFAGDDEPAPYVDNYLADDATFAFTEEQRRSERPGRRTLESELVYYDSSNDFFGDETEMALMTRWRQETLNWGELDAEVMVSSIESDFLGRAYKNEEVYFTLRQTNAPLDNGWLMNSTAGHQRTFADPFLHSGYRVRLPTSLFVGASMGLGTGTGVGQWYMGKTGDNLGIAVPQFRKNGGEVIGGSWRQPVADGYVVAAEIVNFKDGYLVRDHTSLLAGGSYQAEDGAAQYDLRLLADDSSNFGLWTDSRNVLRSDMVVRYGGFYLEPDLAWIDRPIVNDQYGAYARIDQRAYLYSYSVGLDYTKAGIKSDSLFDAEYQSLFANGSLRLTRRLSIGANANLMLREFRSATNDSQVAWRLSSFVNYQFPLGTGRAELYATQLDSDQPANSDDVIGGRFTYDWRMPQGYQLTTEAQLEEQSRLSADRSNQRISVLFRQNIASSFSWGTDASFFRDAHQRFGNTTSIGISADLRWQFLNDWYASASIVHNQSSLSSSPVNVFGGETDLQSNSVWLRFGYANTSGQAFQRFGRNTNAAGSGRISGQVFFDENRDYIRQPGERAAVGVVVMINGRYEVRTDALGRYSFDSVYPGAHRVSIATEDLPLPWGLDDDAPQRVDVTVRQTSTVDFPLVDLNGG